jgi:hypothetical protein
MLTYAGRNIIIGLIKIAKLVCKCDISHVASIIFKILLQFAIFHYIFHLDSFFNKLGGIFTSLMLLIFNLATLNIPMRVYYT